MPLPETHIAGAHIPNGQIARLVATFNSLSYPENTGGVRI